MKRKRGVWGLVFVLVVLSLVSAQQVLANAAPIGFQEELLKYEVSVKKFEVSYDGGSTWVTVFEGVPQKLDIAQGALAGTFFSGQSLPVGTVNKIKVTIDKQITIKGVVSYNDADYFTVSDPLNIDTTNGDNYAEYTFSLDADIIKTMDIDVVVGAGETSTLRITFQVRSEDNAITCFAIPKAWLYMVIPQEVDVTVTQIFE